MSSQERTLRELLRLARNDPLELRPDEWRMLKRLRKQAPEAEAYERHREAAGARARRISRAGREIGPIPHPKNPERRQAALASYRVFCEQYFPGRFYLPWSPAHLAILAKQEIVVTQGGLYALAAPRGFGKTSTSETGGLWAVLGGRRNYVAIVAATKARSVEILESLRVELAENDLLAEDFPEVCFPIRELDGITQRARGQLVNGQPTAMTITEQKLVLASIPSSLASGAILQTAGLTGAGIRGMKHTLTTPSGETKVVRPSLILLDDPQTDATARSETQTESREALVDGAVLGMAGPAQKVAAFMLCTVIVPGDLSDRMIDRELHPEWQGDRIKLMASLPSNEELWEQYARIRSEDLRDERGLASATAFYREHRDAMDEGAAVVWQHWHDADEASAIQHAMNLKLRDERAFWSEYQNDPLPRDANAAKLDASAVAAKVNGRARYQPPAGTHFLTAFVDPGQRLLYYAVCAWEAGFTGYVIDYGTYPEQGLRYFTMRQARRTLCRAHPGAGIEGALYAGLEKLIGNLTGREWVSENGAVMRINQLFVDQGWQPDTVHLFCRQSEHGALVMPSRGQPIGASQVPVSEYRRGTGERIGHHWWVPATKGRRVLRHLEVDVNYWKSFVYDRLATPMGDRGCLSLYGRQGTLHKMLAAHVTAEYRVATEGRGRHVDEWRLPPHQPDNHLFDCLVGCAAGASYCGLDVGGMVGARPQQPKQRRRLSELQRQKRGWR